MCVCVRLLQLQNHLTKHKCEQLQQWLKPDTRLFVSPHWIPGIAHSAPEYCSAVSGKSIDDGVSHSPPLNVRFVRHLASATCLQWIRLQLRGVPKSHLHFEERPHLLRHVGYGYDDEDDADDSVNGEWRMVNHDDNVAPPEALLTIAIYQLRWTPHNCIKGHLGTF